MFNENDAKLVKNIDNFIVIFKKTYNFAIY